MASIKGLVGRARGDQVTALTAEVAALREVVLNINHVVTQLETTINELNHDVRSGAEAGLPLFLGYSERLRLDADTAIGATQVIERQLAILDDRLAAAADPAARAALTLLVDARPVDHPTARQRGIGRYVTGLLRGLVEIDAPVLALYGSDVEAEVLADAIPDLTLERWSPDVVRASRPTRHVVRRHAIDAAPRAARPDPACDHRGRAARRRGDVRRDPVPVPRAVPGGAERPTAGPAARPAGPHV